MASPLFDFFEVIADELSAEPSRIITRESLRINAEESPLLDELKKWLKASDTPDAIQKAVIELTIHFKNRGSKLPFSYDAVSGRFTALDQEYLNFVKEMSAIRSLGVRSRDFECNVAQRLSKRATGCVHRVGHPRDTKKKSVDFNKHLKALGFERAVLMGHDKDGGLDIIWELPIGAQPHRPLVSVQCKNGTFNIGEADKSVNAGGRSLGQHGGLQYTVHVPCVLFNDYIVSESLTKKQLGFVPLGLTDLASTDRLCALELI